MIPILVSVVCSSSIGLSVLHSMSNPIVFHLVEHFHLSHKLNPTFLVIFFLDFDDSFRLIQDGILLSIYIEMNEKKGDEEQFV